MRAAEVDERGLFTAGALQVRPLRARVDLAQTVVLCGAVEVGVGPGDRSQVARGERRIQLALSRELHLEVGSGGRDVARRIAVGGGQQGGGRLCARILVPAPPAAAHPRLERPARRHQRATRERGLRPHRRLRRAGPEPPVENRPARAQPHDVGLGDAEVRAQAVRRRPEQRAQLARMQQRQRLVRLVGDAAHRAVPDILAPDGERLAPLVKGVEPLAQSDDRLVRGQRLAQVDRRQGPIARPTHANLVGGHPPGDLAAFANDLDRRAGLAVGQGRPGPPVRRGPDTSGLVVGRA